TRRGARASARRRAKSGWRRGCAPGRSPERSRRPPAGACESTRGPRRAAGCASRRRGSPARGRARAPVAARALSRAPVARARALHLTLGVGLGHRVALVERLLAFGDADQQLGAAAREIELERNDRLALLLDGGAERLDLAFVEQQLAASDRVHVPAIALLVR